MHALAQYPHPEKKPRYSPKPAFAYAYTPASRSGLRTARVWNTNASISMPVPAMAQAIRAPKTPAERAKLRGSENTPAPTMDPTTIAMSVVSGNFRTCAAALVSVSTEAKLRSSPPQGRVRRKRATTASRLPNHRLRRAGPDHPRGVRASAAESVLKSRRAVHPSGVIPARPTHTYLGDDANVPSMFTPGLFG